MTIFQRAILEEIHHQISEHYGEEGECMTELLEIKPLGAENGNSLHWFVRTNFTSERGEEKVASHVTLYEDGSMSVKLLEIEKQK